MLRLPPEVDIRFVIFGPGWINRSRLSLLAWFPGARPDLRLSVHQGVEGRRIRSNKPVKMLLDSGYQERLVSVSQGPKRGGIDRAPVACVPILKATERVADVLSTDAKRA